ncbi:uncharacterized protein LOC124349822 [Daphnia pulicaria]|uniref:uncharacterized protein LOC124349822 n=1 Tax=Daphnia pulicaria TaxID=35523 RepID=UPI001EEC7549|nr:uncharacterized protein LOC124349822 [Daphnia pulicaria]XP_046656672.1 uncharacterized protein LOC124349822 [Daphnia pulicaria]
MQYPVKSSIRVIGTMLLAREYDNEDVCIMGYPQEVASNGRQFMLKTTDQKSIQVVLSQPIGEHLDGMVQIRGKFDGQRIQAESYNLLLPELTRDFDDNTYNEAVKFLTK